MSRFVWTGREADSRLTALAGGAVVALMAATASAQLDADFRVAPSSGPFPLEVTFTDASTGQTPLSWSWIFGDGGTAQGETVTHTYFEVGTYTVSMTAISFPLAYDTEVKRDVVVVVPPTIDVDFGASPSSGPNPLTVAFTDATTAEPLTGWSWNFGDGGTSEDQDPVHTYTAPGTYSVSLTAEVYGASATLTKTDLIVVDPAPLEPDFTTTPISGVGIVQATFTDTTSGTTPTAWLWDFGDGSTSTKQDPTHGYGEPGTYSVSLTAFVGEQSASITKTEVVTVLPPTSLWLPRDTLAAEDGVAYDAFGTSVALCGDTIVVGAPETFTVASQAGTAHVFERDGVAWIAAATLVPQDTHGHDLFGSSVALSGETIVVGSQGDDDAGSGSGSAYVFARDADGWTERAKLTASDAAPGDGFGSSVGLHGDTIVAGARGDDEAGDFTGAAYVFGRSAGGWIEQAKLIADDPAAAAFFGTSVAIHGDTAVIGSYDTPGGSAYVFVRDGASWSQQALLTADDAGAGDSLGSALSIDGDTLLVGAPGDDDGALNAGAAYVFVRQGTRWSQQAKLTAYDPEANDGFGASVALDGEQAVVGARDDDDGGQSSGSVYVFVREGASWLPQAKLPPEPAPFYDRFGTSVAIQGDVLAVGSLSGDGAASDTGTATVFEGTEVWVDLGYALAGSAGEPRLSGAGARVAGFPVVLTLTDALEQAGASLVVGVTTVLAPLKGGTLVPASDLVLAPLITSGDGEIVLSGVWPDDVPAGLTFYFQCWIADPAGPQGFAASNGVGGSTP